MKLKSIEEIREKRVTAKTIDPKLLQVRKVRQAWEVPQREIKLKML